MFHNHYQSALSALEACKNPKNVTWIFGDVCKESYPCKHPNGGLRYKDTGEPVSHISTLSAALFMLFADNPIDPHLQEYIEQFKKYASDYPKVVYVRFWMYYPRIE